MFCCQNILYISSFGLFIFTKIFTVFKNLFSFINIFVQVQYQSEQFLDKNKDYVVPEHQDLLSASKCSFVEGLFPPEPEENTKSSNKSAKFSSIGSRFKVYYIKDCAKIVTIW